MENTDTMADESLESVPQPTYEALEERQPLEENNIQNTMEAEDNNNLEDEDDGDVNDDGDDEEDDDIEKEIENFIKLSPSTKNPNKDNISNHDDNEDEEFSHDFDEEEDISEEYVQDESQAYVEEEHVIPDKHDSFIVQDKDGMIKKIKICNNKDLNQLEIDRQKHPQEGGNIKIKKIQNPPNTEANKSLQPRSSTPMSREYLALQRSVNESKILTGFVTETANEKPRKLRIKDSTANTSSTSTTDHSYSSVRKSNNSGNQLSPEKAEASDATNNAISPSTQAKRHYHKRYAPLKDDSDVESSSLRPRSRSKSMHNSEFAVTGSHKKLKKWPSEERINKRTNMRSENSEFVQKQMDFLQRVIHSCDMPRSLSRSRSSSRERTHIRSRSSGKKSPFLSIESEGKGGLAITQQTGNLHKSNKLSASKERTSKRINLENDESQLNQNSQISLMESMEHPDDVSVNESNTSVLGVSAIADTHDVDALEAHLKSIWQPPPKVGSDSFCWKCHEADVNLCCSKCVRTFHAACAKMYKLDNTWVCPECSTVENMLNNPKRSRRNELSLDLLSQLLSFALKRMRYAKGHYNFLMPYEESTIYNKYIINPVTLNKLQTQIELKEFRCAEELVNETKWMLHNAYILSSGSNTKSVLAAKSIFKICRQEANEIETCAECYLNANTRTDWFVDVCSQPHLLLWSKLKGFPYWPAKAMGMGQNSLVNVRFFGEHDRAFVPMKDCFLYSEQDPNTATGKRAAKELADCIKEVEEHIEKIKIKVGAFKYAAFKTPYDPAEEMAQLEEMMPGVQEFIKKQQMLNIKPSLQFKIYKTADNNLSIVHKASTTPELHDNDMDKKKKNSLSEGDDCKKEEDFNKSPPKYEVISKVTSDESNSSKLSTVILKRKSVNGDSKKIPEDEPIELPLPKMTKIEHKPLEGEANKVNSKRKSETQNLEKPKAKYSKPEPKIPVITIKTNLTKDSPVIITNEVQKTTLEVTTKEVISPNKPTQQNESNESLATQKAVENLVKNKQGVTIKKVCKDVSNSPEQTKSNTIKDPLDITADTKKSPDKPKEVKTKQKTEDEKDRENQKVNNILKGLVPFVEVKKEVLSDNEQETGKPQNDKTPAATNIIKPTNKTTEATKEIVSKEVTSNNTATAVKQLTDKQASATTSTTPLITEVKEEILSDDDETNPTLNKIKSSTKPQTIAVEKTNPTITNTEVRMVGDTTIQKLSCKNIPNQYIISNSSTSSSFISQNNISTKRTSLRGIPYGPLPASAFPKTSVTSRTLIQQNDLSLLQPRAKKSFPQTSPPVEKIKLTVNPTSSAQIISNSTSTTNSHLDPKKSMAKTTMVAIPVDVATHRASTSVGTIIGSIPIPPLTAVSKTIPYTSTSSNSMARNSTSTITVSGTSSSLTTPSIMAQTKTSAAVSLTSTTTARSSPITVASSTVTIPTSASPSSLSQQTNPLTMSTPPPLAGLSGGTNLTNSTQNGLNDLSTPSPASSLGTTQSSTDTHLLGGLVTPTLASAITEVICRGPPKLAVRPNGPLQSEGHPMFPSQAGPVCKRLVENVHKLTDFFISVVEDTMGEMAQGDDGSLQAKITLLTMELERSKQAYEQEVAELKRTSDLMLCEMRKSMENEKTRLAIEIRKQCEMERIRSVEETKRKQWCATCSREANFYCCWNTSYCDYPCQQLHWSRHASSCAQTRPCSNDTTASGTTTTTGTSNSFNQQERHHAAAKSNNSSTSLNSSVNFNKSTTTISSHTNKKEKIITKISTNHHIMPSAMSAAATPSTSRTNTEVLKLPTNTFLRPVTNSVNSQTLRCNTTYSIPVQRFNVPLPITTPANTISPQTFTIVQQGNSWVMSSGGNNVNSTSNANNSTTSSATIAAPIVSVPQVATQQRAGIGGGAILTNKNSKTQIRYH